MTVEFTVIGEPAPKGSHTAVVRGGRAILLNGGPNAGTRKRYETWKRDVTEAATRAMNGRPPLGGAVAMTVTFWLKPPKTETRAERARVFHAKRFDLSKLLRAIEDPMNGIVYDDDARIAVVRCEKKYARDGRWPGASVTITKLPDGD